MYYLRKITSQIVSYTTLYFILSLEDAEFHVARKPVPNYFNKQQIQQTQFAIGIIDIAT